MIAVLINEGNVRLGQTSVSDGCRLIQFGGGFFIRTDEDAVLDGGGLGPVFQMTVMDVIGKLDSYNPTSNFSKRK